MPRTIIYFFLMQSRKLSFISLELCLIIHHSSISAAKCNEKFKVVQKLIPVNQSYNNEMYFFSKSGWLQVEGQLSVYGTQAYMGSVRLGGLYKGSQPVFKRVSEKITENFKRLGRQARSGIEPSTSRLPLLRAEAFGHW